MMNMLCECVSVCVCVSVIYQLALTQFDLSLQLMQASTSEDSDVNNNDPHIVDLADISKKYVRKEGLSQMKGSAQLG